MREANKHHAKLRKFYSLLFLGTELRFISHDIDIMKLWFSFKKNPYLENPKVYYSSELAN